MQVQSRVAIASRPIPGSRWNQSFPAKIQIVNRVDRRQTSSNQDLRKNITPAVLFQKKLYTKYVNSIVVHRGRVRAFNGRPTYLLNPVGIFEFSRDSPKRTRASDVSVMGVRHMMAPVWLKSSVSLACLTTLALNEHTQ
jgi:hypothetical protein